MANTETSQLAEVITQLKSLNLSGEVIMDAIDDNNKLVTRSLLIGSQAEGERVDNGGQLLAVVTSLRRMVSDISRSNKELLEFFTSNDMQQEENRKDLLAALRERDKESTKPKEKPKKGKKDSESGLAGILAFAAGLIGGTVVGFVSEVAAMFRALIGDGKIGTGIIKGFNTIRTILSFLFTGVQLLFTGLRLIGEALAGLAMESALVKSVTNTISQIANAWARFTGDLRAVGDMIRPLFGTAEEGLKIGARLSKIFPNIAKFFTALGDILGGLARGFKTGVSIGKTIARLLPAIFGLLKSLALPLTVAIALYETVMGAIEGFKTDGVLGAVKGAISGLLIGLVGGLVDLVKDIVSWIANKLGFENFSKLLDGFSFSQLLKDGVDAIFDTVIYAFDWFKSIFSFEKFSKAFENFGLAGIWLTFTGGILDTLKGAVSWIATMFGAFDIANALDNFSFTDIYKSVFDAIGEAIDSVIHWIMNIPTLISELAGQMGQAIDGALSGVGNIAEGFAKSVLRDVLPDPAATGLLNPMSWVAKAIPDSIYEYAGLKAGGNEITPGAVNGKMSTGEQLSDGEKSSKSKPVVTPITNTTGAELLNSSNTISVSPVIVNNYGGNTTNTTQSSVNNNSSSYDPIMTGSAMGFASV